MGLLGEFQSLLPPTCRVMALTATATKQVRLYVSKRLGLVSPYVLCLPPAKPNAFYSVARFISLEESFSTVLYLIYKTI